MLFRDYSSSLNNALYRQLEKSDAELYPQSFGVRVLRFDIILVFSRTSLMCVYINAIVHGVYVFIYRKAKRTLQTNVYICAHTTPSSSVAYLALL